MAFSGLIKSQILSPNYSERTEKICKITPHHAAGVLTAENLAKIFSKTSRQASCNYAIGNDGTIIGVVDEKYRAWTSSSRWNDQRAITIEVSNSATGGQWPISDAALNSLIKLCVDICKRNNIKKLEFTGTKDGSLTMHKMFAATSCPGPYLESKFPYIAEQVNATLNPVVKPVSKKSNEEIAKEVIAGKWGNGADRKKRLTESGYDYDAVQKIVDSLVKGNSTSTAKPSQAPVKKSNEEIAKEVIAGKWGNGAVRKNKLKAAGYDYDTIQSIVKNMLNKPAVNSTSKPASSTAVYYTVKSGDTLGAIAKRYGVTVNSIMALNKSLIKNANVIRAGWKIRVK